MRINRPLPTHTVEGGRISLQQLFFLCIILVISTANIILPNLIADIAREDAWIAVIIATILAMGTVWIACKLQLAVGPRNIIGTCDQILGHIIGRIVSFLYIIFFLTVAAIILRQLNEIMLNVFLRNTPILVISISMILVVAYGAFHGLEVYSRVTEILTPLGILTLLLVILFNVTDIELKNFAPSFYYGITPILYASLLLYMWLSQVVLLVFMVGPHLRELDNRLTQVTVSATAVLGIMLMLGVLAIAVFGPERTAQLQFPALDLVRNIDIYDFIQRLDAFIFAIWVGGIAIKLIILYHFIVVGLSQWFGIKKYKTIVPPIGVLIIVMSILMFPDLHTLIAYMKYIQPLMVTIFLLGFPLLLLGVFYIRKNSKKFPIN